MSNAFSFRAPGARVQVEGRQAVVVGTAPTGEGHTLRFLDTGAEAWADAPCVTDFSVFDDPQTIPMGKLLEHVHRDWAKETGHVFNGPDGLVYRLVAWRKNDGPWMEEVLARAPTRTISERAIDRSFHHHKVCPVKGCRADVTRRTGPESVRWSGLDKNGWPREATHEQRTDGRTVWVNADDGMCIGRLSPAGIDIHHGTAGQLAGEHCLFCEPGANPFAKEIPFAMYLKFCVKMQEHHGVGVSWALPVHIERERRLFG